ADIDWSFFTSFLYFHFSKCRLIYKMKKKFDPLLDSIADIKNGEDEPYYKGINFEREFADYMKSELKWNGVKIRSQQAHNHNTHGTNVDIIAWRFDTRGKQYKNYGIFLWFSH